MKVSMNLPNKLLSENQLRELQDYIRQIQKVSESNSELSVVVNYLNNDYIVGLHWKFKKLEISSLSKKNVFIEASTDAFASLFKDIKHRREKKFGNHDETFASISYDDDESA